MSINGLYLTSLKKVASAPPHRASFSLKQLPFTFKDYQNKKEKEKEKERAIQESFVKFIIEEKTHYANFPLSEVFYCNRLQKSYNKYNLLQSTIEEKRNEYKEVVLLLQNELLEKCILDNKKIKRYYEYHINKTTEEINIKQHELECYQNAYKRLYKSNYLIKKRLEDEQEFQSVSDKQFEKYIILKNNALQSTMKQGLLLSNFKQFNENYEVIAKEEFNQKISHYAHHKKEVEHIQREMKGYEEVLKGLVKEQGCTNDALRLVVQENQKSFKEYKANSSEFCVLKGKTQKLFFDIRAKDVSSFVIEINKLRRGNESHKIQYDQLNDYITELLTEQSKSDTLLRELKEKAAERQAINTKCILVKDSNNKFNGLIEEMSNSNKLIVNKIVNGQKTMNILFMFMSNYLHQLYSISTTRHRRKDTDSPYSINHWRQDYPKYFIMKRDYPHMLHSNCSFDKELFKLIYCLSRNFFKVVMTSLYTTFDTNAQRIFNSADQTVNEPMVITPSQSQSEEDSLNALEYPTTNDNQLIMNSNKEATSNPPQAVLFNRKASHSISLIYLLTKDVLADYNKCLLITSKKNEQQRRVISRNESSKEAQQLQIQQYQELSKQKPQKTSSSLINSEISSNDIYQSYLTHLEKQKEKDQMNQDISINKTFFESYPQKSMSLINKYSTHLVKHDYNNKSSKRTKIKKKLKRRSSSQFIERKRVITSENSYAETPQCERKIFDVNEDKKEKYFGSSFSKERVLLYFRINDLRKLEMSYFKQCNRSTGQFSNYNELYFQFKKKFNKSIDKKKGRSSSVILRKPGNNKKSRDNSFNKVKESKSLNFPQQSKNVTNGSGMSSTLKDMNSTTKTIIVKGRNADNFGFTLTHRLASLDSTNNLTGILFNKDIKRASNDPSPLHHVN